MGRAGLMDFAGFMGRVAGICRGNGGGFPLFLHFYHFFIIFLVIYIEIYIEAVRNRKLMDGFTIYY
jgi:hypothetical protein